MSPESGEAPPAPPDPLPGKGNSAAPDRDAAPPAAAPPPAPPGPVRKWVLGARPRTLPAAVVPVLVGTAVAWCSNDVPLLNRIGLSFFQRHLGADSQARGIDPWRLLLVLIVALAVQIGTNYANDHSDGVRGTDDVRVGPMRLVASGAASARAVMLAAWLAFAVGGVAGLVLASETTWWLVAVGAVCVAAGWLYTGGPKPYGYLGLGELFVFVFFGVVATVGSAFVQEGTLHLPAVTGSSRQISGQVNGSITHVPPGTPINSFHFPAPPFHFPIPLGNGHFDPSALLAAILVGPRNGHIDPLAFLAAIPVGLLAVALLEANNLRDVSGDQLVGKRTLAVRLGRRRGGWLYVGTLMAVLLGVAGVVVVRPWALLALFGIPLAIRPLRLAFSETEGRGLLPMLVATARLQLLAGLLLAIGIVL